MPKNKRNLRLTAICLCLFLTAGCSNNQDNSTSSAPADTLPPIDRNGAQAELTVEQAETFAAGWVAAIVNNNADSGAKMILFDRIINRALSGFELPTKQVNEITKGMHAGRPIHNLITQLSQNQKAGGSYELVNTASRAGERHAILRMVDPNGAMNYHDLRLLEQNGKICADQIFIAMTGESFADSLKTVLAPMIASESSIVSRLSGESQKQLKELEMQRDLVTAARNGQAAQVKQLYEKLSAKSQAMKLVQLGRIMASANEDDVVYLALLDQYAERFPDDPSLGLVLIDAAYLRKDPVKLQKAYDALNAWTGGDYYLTLIISTAMAEFGELERGKALYRNIDPQSFRTENAHDIGLGSAMALDEFDGMLRHLTALKNEYNYDFQDLRQVEGYEGFVQSEQFKEWDNQ